MNSPLCRCLCLCLWGEREGIQDSWSLFWILMNSLLGRTDSEDKPSLERRTLLYNIQYTALYIIQHKAKQCNTIYKARRVVNNTIQYTRQGYPRQLLYNIQSRAAGIQLENIRTRRSSDLNWRNCRIPTELLDGFQSVDIRSLPMQSRIQVAPFGDGCNKHTYITYKTCTSKVLLLNHFIMDSK